MSRIIAVAGKGGVGKTTLAGLLVASLIRTGRRPVLAVDADPNSCLDGVLGVKAERTVGRLREEARDEGARAAASGMSKRELLEIKIAEGLVEAQDFDLIAMGRPEGPGCYCYANNVLREVLQEIAGSYPYVVLDNEAGLENLSRRIVTRVDLLVLAGDPSRRGIETMARLHGLAREMGIEHAKLALVVNRLRRAMPAEAEALREATGADLLLGLPDDDELAGFGESGRSLLEIGAGNPVARLVAERLVPLID